MLEREYAIKQHVYAIATSTTPSRREALHGGDWLSVVKGDARALQRVHSFLYRRAHGGAGGVSARDTLDTSGAGRFVSRIEGCEARHPPPSAAALRRRRRRRHRRRILVRAAVRAAWPALQHQ